MSETDLARQRQEAWPSRATTMTPKSPGIQSQGDRLTLQLVREGLEDRGVKIALSSLSVLVGKLADQLGAVRKEGAKGSTYPAAAVEALAAFIPYFRRIGGKLDQAEFLLRAFQGGGGDAASLQLISTEETGISAFRRNAEIDPLEIAEAQGRAQGFAIGAAASNPSVMTASEAAEFLRITPRLLRKTVKPWKRYGGSPKGDRWRLADLIAS